MPSNYFNTKLIDEKHRFVVNFIQSKETDMPIHKKRITSYVGEKKHRELKTFCGRLGITMSRFIDIAIEEKADRERQEYGFKREKEEKDGPTRIR